MDKSYCSAHFETKWHIGEAKADKDTEILSQRSSIGPESSISCIGLKRKKCSTAFSDSISSQRLKTSSVVWEHFKRTEVNSVCNYCSKKYSLSTATGILQKHLKALHAGKFNPGKSMMANWIAKETKTAEFKSQEFLKKMDSWIISKFIFDTNGRYGPVIFNSG
jgi:hypothetical protein